MDSDYEFDGISDEDWDLLDQNVVAPNVGAQPPGPTVTHHAGNSANKPTSGPLSSVSGRQNISSSSSRAQRQPDQVFKRSLPVSGTKQNGRQTVRTSTALCIVNYLCDLTHL